MASSSRAWLVVLVVFLAAFSSGVLVRPAGEGWQVAYDLVFYNGVAVAAAAVCWLAARRRPAERLAWWALTVAFMSNVIGDSTYTLVVARMAEEPYPSVSDAFYLTSYVGFYIAVIGLIRARVSKFPASMWLDGLVGALGAAAIAIALLLRPALHITGAEPLAVAVNLAYPLADVLLLSLLVGMGAMLGLRSEPTFLLLGAGLICFLIGDITWLGLTAREIYIEGSSVDLAWLLGYSAITLAAHRVRPAVPTGSAAIGREPSRVSWRVLAIPLACNAVSLLLLGIGWGDRLPGIAAWCAIACVVAGLARTVATLNELRAISEARAEARTDELTALPNRRALLEHTVAALAQAGADRPVALLLMDLDGFKEVNDSLGHHAGDELLRQIGPRLRPVLRPGDVLARLGGDEFAVLLPATDLVSAERLATRLATTFDGPFTVGDIRLHVGVSIGVASGPVPAPGVSELLRRADVAMYAAKRSRAGVHVFVPDPGSSAFDRLHTMEELRTGIADDQLTVHLQPQIELDGGRVVGVEALVRWHHPTRGLVMPADLLPAAEQAGLLQALADTVLGLALVATARWWPVHPVPVSVNLSAASVTDIDLPAKVGAALMATGLPPQALVLEVVEDTLMSDPDRARTVLSQLRNLGVRVSIDDYGSGYSSLTWLHQLPADELKLDRLLTRDIGVGFRSDAIVRHTVALAHDLGLRVVAEGIEEPSAARTLADLGCDIGQGYAIGKPMPVDTFIRWLANHPTVHLDGPVPAVDLLPAPVPA